MIDSLLAFPSVTLGAQPPALWNALMSYGGQALPLAVKGATATFTELGRPVPSMPGMLVSLADGEQIVLLVTNFPLQRVFDAQFSVEDLQTLPPALRHALWDGILATLWSAVQDSDLGPLRRSDSGDSLDLVKRLAGPPTWLAVSIQGLFPESIEVLLGCRASWLLRRLADRRLAPRHVWPALKRALHVDVFETIGRMVMPLAQLRGLCPGDVIVLGTERPDLRTFRTTHGSWDFQRRDQAWECKGSRPANESRKREVSMDQDHDDATLIDALQIPIDFDIGQSSVSLAEVETWQTGALVPLNLPSAEGRLEVTLRSHGRILATGDLVRIDERLAVRLTRLLMGGGPA